MQNMFENTDEIENVLLLEDFMLQISAISSVQIRVNICCCKVIHS
jgi:hypothetical protein